MNKKTILIALAAISAAMFALPAAASANWGVTPGNAVFHGTTTTRILTVESEPTVTCLGPNHLTGTYDGSGTTGTLSLTYTECHTFILGITRRCTTGPEPKTENTITTSGTFHNVTITSGKRGVLVTPAETTIRCQSALHPIKVTGNVIGELTSPTGACPVGPFTNGTLVFGTAGGIQLDKTVDGSATEYNLSGETEGTGIKKQAGDSASAEFAFTEPVTIDCNTP